VNAAVLSEAKRDALQELVNIGMGSAGAALAKVLGAFVELTVPRIDLLDRRRAALLLGPDIGSWSETDIEAVRQPFFGGMMGESLMLFDGAEPARLADLIGLAESPTAEEQQEMLLDLANVVLGSCVNGIAEPLQEVVSFSPPSRLGGRPQACAFVLEEGARGMGEWQQALVVNVEFKLEERSFRSRVLVFLSETSLVRIDHAIERFLDALAS
jgi:chemotaxis protein CheC